MNREQLEKELGKPVLQWIGIAQILFLIAFILSPLFCIWGTLSFAWKLGLTGLIGVLITMGLYRFFKHIIKEVVDEDFRKGKI